MKRTRRKYQKVALVAIRQTRQVALYWTRRGRKSTTLGEIAFDEMSAQAGRTVIAASASLLLGRELVNMTMSAAEQAMIVGQESAAMRDVFEQGAADKQLDFKVADSEKGKILTGLTAEDFANLYKSSRMEMRLYFDRTHYSRLLVIAPNPATARSWRATVLRDEAGYTPPALELELQAATDPMMRDVPELKMIYASNLSKDDRHPYFEMTMPREITAETEDAQFPPNEAGHLYIGQTGILVHRVALKDAYASGHQLYDDHSRAMTYGECLQNTQIRRSLNQSYALNHEAGGASALDLVSFLTALRRGIGQTAFVQVVDALDVHRAMHLLRALLGDGPVGIGFDVATTTSETSNPSSITFTEGKGAERLQRLVLIFKSGKRQLMREYLTAGIMAVRERPRGGPARRLCIDATSERLAADELRDDLCHLIPVELVISSKSIEPEGYKEPINYKTYLGDLYSAKVNEGHYAIPSDDYIKRDQRLVIKNGGRYECPVEPDGAHGDTFDSGKLAEWALVSTAGGIETTEGISFGTQHQTARFVPRQWRAGQ